MYEKKLFKKRNLPPPPKFDQSPLHVLSHQLRSPVYSVRNALDLLHEYKKKDPYLRNVLLIARRKCNQLIKLLEDLLKITDAKLQQITSSKHEPISLSKIIEKVIAQEGDEVKKNVLFKDDLEKNGYKFYLKSNKELLEQAITNLLENAIIYSKPNSRVIIKANFSNQFVEILVKDHGPGIPQKEQPLIFAPFYRLPNIKNGNPQGNGLGLTITKLFIEKMNGSIGVKSKINKGSVFWIKLPITKNSKKRTYIVGKK